MGELKRFQSARNGKCFESESFFGNLWTLRCAPNGESEDEEGLLSVWLQLNALPKNVSKMKVQFELKCVETGTRGLFVHAFNIAKSAAAWTKIVRFADIQALESLTFCAAV